MKKEKEEKEMEQKIDQVEKKEEKKVQSVSDLPGIGPATKEKLEAVGYGELMSIAVATPGELVGATEMSEATAKKVIAIARANIQMEFTTGEEVLKKRNKIVRVTTGSEEFDKLLGGGLETGAITEVYGQYGAGKSQLAHVFAVRSQLPVGKGGIDGSVVFIDTESTFRPERIVQIANALKMDSNKVLKNIHVARAYNSDHQMLLAEKIDDLIFNE